MPSGLQDGTQLKAILAKVFERKQSMNIINDINPIPGTVEWLEKQIADSTIKVNIHKNTPRVEAFLGDKREVLASFCPLQNYEQADFYTENEYMEGYGGFPLSAFYDVNLTPKAFKRLEKFQEEARTFLKTEMGSNE